MGTAKLAKGQSVNINGGFDQDEELSTHFESETKTSVPQLEITEDSTTLSSSNSDEDSAVAKEEGKKKRLTKRKKMKKSDGEIPVVENELSELRNKIDSLTKENETMNERVDNLSKEKNLLEENLKDERKNVKVCTVFPVRFTVANSNANNLNWLNYTGCFLHGGPDG